MILEIKNKWILFDKRKVNLNINVKKIMKFEIFIIYIIIFNIIALNGTEEVVWLNGIKFDLSPKIEMIAKKNHANLNGNPLFFTPFVREIKQVHNYLFHKYGGNGTKISCKTKDGEIINCTYFDRNSDILLVIGAGFTNPQEYMVPFIGMFDCDVAIFDYRGHGYYETNWYNPISWKFKPAKILFGVDGSKVKMGEIEHEDIIAVVEALKQKKKYKQVCGLGVCYSSLIFIKAQAIYKKRNNKNLFDKLIGDGTWLSLSNQVSRIMGDLQLMNDPQNGGCSDSCILSQPWFLKIFQWTVETISRIKFSKLQVNIMDYISYIDIPLLFFHGKNDLFVPLCEFEEIWNSAENANKKIGIVTTNPHVRNHLRQKELYKFICDLFMKSSYKECVKCLQIF